LDLDINPPASERIAPPRSSATIEEAAVPVKQRIPKVRRPFDDETLALFIELERIPRGSPEFNDKSKQLGRLWA
jgi:hypothetical protein